MSRLEIFCGCMFAGKTAALIAVLEAERAAGRCVRAFKHGLDNRYGSDALITHDGRRFPARALTSVAELEAAIGDAEVVAVDEIQFFGREALEFSLRWLGRERRGSAVKPPGAGPPAAGSPGAGPPGAEPPGAGSPGVGTHDAGALDVVSPGGGAANRRTLIVAGIDHDAWGRPFPPLPQLRELADRVQVFTAPCRACGAPARFSQRMIPLTDEFMVGGAEAYQPRCGRCFVPLACPAPEY